MAGASAGLRRLSEPRSIDASGSVMQSKGFCADREFRVNMFLLWIDKVPSERRPNLV
jgi:hypothetical protein